LKWLNKQIILLQKKKSLLFNCVKQLEPLLNNCKKVHNIETNLNHEKYRFQQWFFTFSMTIIWSFFLQWLSYSRVRNKRTPTLINFLTFFQGLQPYSGLHRAYFSSISIRYKWGYAYSFCQIFQGLRLFKGLRLFQTLE